MNDADKKLMDEMAEKWCTPTPEDDLYCTSCANESFKVGYSAAHTLMSARLEIAVAALEQYPKTTITTAPPDIFGNCAMVTESLAAKTLAEIKRELGIE